NVAWLKHPSLSVACFYPSNSATNTNKTASRCIVEDVVVAVGNAPVRRKHCVSDGRGNFWDGFGIWRCWRVRLRLFLFDTYIPNVRLCVRRWIKLPIAQFGSCSRFLRDRSCDKRSERKNHNWDPHMSPPASTVAHRACKSQLLPRRRRVHSAPRQAVAAREKH